MGCYKLIACVVYYFTAVTTPHNITVPSKENYIVADNLIANGWFYHLQLSLSLWAPSLQYHQNHHGSSSFLPISLAFHEQKVYLTLHDNANDGQSGEQPKDKRKSYSRESKMAALQYFHECNNKYKTAKKFGVNPATLRGWLKNETKIKSSQRGTRKIGCG